MALEKRRISEIPSDAIILSEQEALTYQNKVLNSWKKTSDVFAYKYGSLFLSGASMLAGMYLNNHFRIKFKLLHYGRGSSYLPIVALPGALSFFLHQEMILRELVLSKQEQCPICIEMRASVLQTLIGCGLPLILAPVASIGLVHKYETFNMPYITQEPKKVFNLLKRQITPIKNVLLGMIIGHALLASAVTYFEAKSIYKVNFKLKQLERELEFSDNLK